MNAATEWAREIVEQMGPSEQDAIRETGSADEHRDGIDMMMWDVSVYGPRPSTDEVCEEIEAIVLAVIVPLAARIDAVKATIENARDAWTGLNWDEGFDWIDKYDNQHVISANSNAGIAGEIKLVNDARYQMGLGGLNEAEEYRLTVAVERADDCKNVVDADAESARDKGQKAIDALSDHPDFDCAMAAIEDAVRIEMSYGDNPTWGPVLAMLQQLLDDTVECVEYVGDLYGDGCGANPYYEDDDAFCDAMAECFPDDPRPELRRTIEGGLYHWYEGDDRVLVESRCLVDDADWLEDEEG